MMASNPSAKIVVAWIAALAILQADCSQRRALSLSAPEAAKMAATLANQECARLYQERPFRAAQHPAVLKNGTYQWGGLDITASNGFSALVTFRADGGKTHVEIFFVHDPPPQMQPGPDIVPFGRQ